MNPTIKDAKDICTRYRKRGAIILSFDSTTYHFSSYGFSRDWCNQMRHVVEQLAGVIQSGFIDIPDTGFKGGKLVFDPVAEDGGIKSCPNPKCPGGWLCDLRDDGMRVCPVCKTEFQETKP